MFNQSPSRIHYDLQQEFESTNYTSDLEMENHYTKCLDMAKQHPHELDKTFQMNGFIIGNKNSFSVPMTLYELALLLWPLKYTVQLLKQHPLPDDVVLPNLSHLAFFFNGTTVDLDASRFLSQSEIQARRNIVSFCCKFKHFYNQVRGPIGVWEALTYRYSEYDVEIFPIKDPDLVKELNDILPPFPRQSIVLSAKNNFDITDHMTCLMFTLSSHPQLLKKLGPDQQEYKIDVERALLQKHIEENVSTMTCAPPRKM